MKLLGIIRDPTCSVLSIDMKKCRIVERESNRIELHFCWYDFWVGLYWSHSARALYVCPLPMLAIKISFGEKKV